MYVCICNAVTDKEIRAAATTGVSNLWDLQKKLGVAAACGSCKEHAMEVLAEAKSGTVTEPRVYRPAAG